MGGKKIQKKLIENNTKNNTKLKQIIQEFEKKNHKYEVLNGQFLYKHNVEIPKNTDIEEINE